MKKDRWEFQVGEDERTERVYLWPDVKEDKLEEFLVAKLVLANEVLEKHKEEEPENPFTFADEKENESGGRKGFLIGGYRVSFEIVRGWSAGLELWAEMDSMTSKRNAQKVLGLAPEIQETTNLRALMRLGGYESVDELPSFSYKFSIETADLRELV